MSIEQAVRDILTAALQAGVVLGENGDDPQTLSAGVLAGPANVLAEFVARSRWIVHETSTAEVLPSTSAYVALDPAAFTSPAGDS